MHIMDISARSTRAATFARLDAMQAEHDSLIRRPNERLDGGNAIFHRYRHPVLTAEHTPIFWRYDLSGETNPLGLERMGVNAVFNPGAIKLDGRYLLVVRVEGVDRKSFFAVAESANGIDGWRFWDHPVRLPQTSDPDVNVYDMRLTAHEDG